MQKFNNALRDLSEQELKKDVNSEDFQFFKDCRTQFSKTFIPCFPAQNKLNNPSRSKQHIKINYNFSPAVKNREVIRRCQNKIDNLQDELEKLATASIHKDLIAQITKAEETLQTSINNEDTARTTVIIKAFRTVKKKP